MYDIAVIGAGINGCSIAYELTQVGKSVLVLDKDGIASGGSGAAGAFISPKFSKAGELKEIIHNAFLYSMEYYYHHFPQHFTQAQLLHLAKDEEEDITLNIYKQTTPLPLKVPSQTTLQTLSSFAKEREYVSIDAGVVDAPKMCQAMLQKATFLQEEVISLKYKEEQWCINEKYYAKKVVLAMGAYKTILDEPYIALRGVWGHRIDVETSTCNPYSIHQFVSIAPSDDGVIAVGATHNVHYHPQKNKEPYNYDEGRAKLLKKASKTLNLKDVKVVRDYTGLRSGSFDYMPLVGPLVMSEETLTCKGKKLRIKKPNFEEFLYYPHLSMINGSGGYGFVLAPYLAKILKDFIIDEKTISQRLVPARFFARWVKRK